jgi:molybdate transport system ATP-binding protein
VLAADFEVRRRLFRVRARLQLEGGERLALVGPSGAGKTTVLSALAGLLPLDSGSVVLDGERLPPSHPGAGGVRLVTQEPALFPHLTVRENILYSRGADRAAAEGLAGRLRLTPLLSARPRALSQGERHRAALARALLSGCRVLLLDEPFAALDRPLAEELLELVVEEVDRLPGGAILVTHQLEDAQAFADRVGVMVRGELVQTASAAELALHPATPEVAALTGYRGWLRGEAGVLAVHPERLADRGPGERITARVVACRPLGTRFSLDLEAEGRWSGRFRQHRTQPAQPGEPLELYAPDPVVYREGAMHG